MNGIVLIAIGEAAEVVHGGAVAPNGDVYIGLLNGTVRKFVRQ